MSSENVFMAFNYGVIPAWGLLIFAPRWKWTWKLVHSGAIVVLMALAYVIMMLAVPMPEGAGGWSLDAAMRIFREPWLTLTAWVHFLAFDLFAGAWVARDAIRRSIPHVAVVPCLVLTNMFGPAGLLLYVAIRAIIRRKAVTSAGSPM